MSNYVYRETDTATFTVGFYLPNREWIPESDHSSPDAAAERVRLLNGGTPTPAPALSHKLRDYPAKIETEQLEILSLAEAIATRQADLQKMDDDFFDFILNAKDESGKPKYTNDAARQTALRKLREADDLYCSTVEVIKTLERTKAKTGFTLERLRNEFSVAKLERRGEIAGLEFDTGSIWREAVK